MSPPEMSPAASPRFPPPLPLYDHDEITAPLPPPPVLSPSLPPPRHHIVAPPPHKSPPPPVLPPLPPPETAVPPLAPIAEVAPPAFSPPKTSIPPPPPPALVVETPPETSVSVDYFNPPPPPESYSYSPPSGRMFLTPPPPPTQYSSDSPPVPVTNVAASPPLMLINGSSPPPRRPPKSLPRPKSSSRIPTNTPSSNKISAGEMVGICVGIGAVFCLVMIIMILIFICKRKKNKMKVDDCESPPPKDKLPPGKQFLISPSKGDSCSATSEPSNQFSPRGPGMVLGFSIGNFSYRELAVATDGFSESNLLGEGGFGYVHKGVLPTGRQIAVKQLKIGSRQGEREFQAEVETISRVHHRHLVSLVGYCIAGVNRLLVYEFVPNRTLSFHLHGKARGVMDWETRLKIAIGSARGLAYLHEDCNPTIIHRDIKTSNILIDSKFEAKVSDFGLAKFFSDADNVISHVSTRVVGTFGYLAPEYALTGKASDKSDMFSFGVVLLELITGLKPIIGFESFTNGSLVTWARPLLRRASEDGNFDGLVDPRLQNNYNVEEMANMVSCAAACVRQTSWRRPRMSQIVRALEGDISLMDGDEGVRAGQGTVSGNLNVDLQNIGEEGISGLETKLSSKENVIDDDPAGERLPSDLYEEEYKRLQSLM